MRKVVIGALGAAVVAGMAGLSFGQVTPNGVSIEQRIFNDYPNSTLTVTNNFSNTVTFDETNFGSGGFANRHAAYFSTDGGTTAHDFGYHDGFDFKFGMLNSSDPATGRESGFHADLFGFGFFGPLPHNGEIAAFGSVLPFHSFGTGIWTPGQLIGLRMIYRPGDGDGVNPLPAGGQPSTIEYLYDLNDDGGFISSGQIPFTNSEGGIPENFTMKLGFGVQNQGAPGGRAFTQFGTFVVPAPGAAALLGLGGLVAIRRRRN